jgi:DNA-binding MurR/RpiR family transcriptional regulator
MRARIESDLKRLSKKQQRVAQYVLDNPAAVIFASAADVASRSGVDAATAVRFAQNLGYAGYTDFRDQLRLQFPTFSTPLDRWEEEAGALGERGTAALIERVRERAIANLESTFEQLTPAGIDASLDLLLGAERVLLAAGGISRLLVLQLHRALQLAQIPVQIIDDWFALIYDASSFKPGDVLFAVTIWRYAKVTVEALKCVHEAGAKSILMTDALFAPGTNIADQVLLFSPPGIVVSSTVAGAAVIDCLAAGIASRVPDKVKDSLSQIADFSTKHGLVYE